jgi:hypothetical protein
VEPEGSTCQRQRRQHPRELQAGEWVRDAGLQVAHRHRIAAIQDLRAVQRCSVAPVGGGLAGTATGAGGRGGMPRRCPYGLPLHGLLPCPACRAFA